MLVVDDNQSAANALGALLRHHGHPVCIAYDGLSALELLDSFPAKIILLDIGLPYRDGYSIARELKAKAAASGTDILLIAISGYGQEEDKRRSKEAGFDLHLVKPVAIDYLLENFVHSPKVATYR